MKVVAGRSPQHAIRDAQIHDPPKFLLTGELVTNGQLRTALIYSTRPV
jgi:hypothetical protein